MLVKVMAEREQKAEKMKEKYLSCQECCQLIPDSVEAEDYVLHFCGLNCYEKWQQTNKNESANKINIYGA